MKRLFLILVVTICLMLMMTSCSEDKPTEPDDPSEPVVSDEATVIPKEEAEDIIIELTDEHIVMPEDADPDLYREGRVLVSSTTEKAPYGFLRKVVGHREEDGQIVVETDQATLEDVFDNLELSITQDLRTTDIEYSTPLVDGVEFVDYTRNPYNFRYNIDHDINLSQDILMNINGDLDLTLGYEFDVKIGLIRGLHYLKSGSYVTSDAGLELSVNGNFDYETEIELYRHSFIPVVITVGHVPIVFHPLVVIVLQIDAEGEASVTSSVTMSADVSTSLEFDEPDWSANRTRDVNFNFSPPSLSADLGANIGAGPRFAVNLYGVAGPYIIGIGYLDLSADVDASPWWTLNGGFKADAGVRFDALGYVMDFGIDDIIDFKTVIAQAPQNRVATPTFDPPGADYNTPQNVSILCETPDATIRYTKDGNAPMSDSPVYSTPIQLSEDTVLKAKAFRSGWDDSRIATAEYTFSETQSVATPTFNPSGGNYDNPQNVTISCATDGATIRFTTDGNDPTENSTVYSTPIEVTETTTVKAIAFKDGWNPSHIATAEYTIDDAQPPPPVMVFVQGTEGVDFGSTQGEGYFNPVIPGFPRYHVYLSSFYISRYEITQSEWTSVMGGIYDPNWDRGQGPNHPAYHISWFDAIEYCNRLSIREGLTPAYSYANHGTNPANWPAGWNTSNANHTNLSCNWNANGYRLPTEMEREFAARGGVPAQNAGTFNDSWAGTNVEAELVNYAWYRDNSNSRTHPVGTKIPNELGLYDMSGNVWNWVWDIRDNYPTGVHNNPTGPTAGASRVFRGGSWYYNAAGCTVSSSGGRLATFRSVDGGFRVSRVIP